MEKKKLTGPRCRNAVDAVRGRIWTSHGGGHQKKKKKKVLTQREGNERGL